MAVSAPTVIAAYQHDVGKVDLLMSDRGVIDDPASRVRFQKRKQQSSEQEARQIVHREAQLVALPAHLAAVTAHADPRIVDEDVQLTVVACDRVGELTHLG